MHFGNWQCWKTRICLPFDKFIDDAFDDAVFSLLLDECPPPDDDDVDDDIDVDDVVMASVPIACDGVDNVGVFGGDSSFTCRADFSLSITALNEPFRLTFAGLLPDDLIESWLDDDASIKLSIGIKDDVDTFA